MNKWIEYNTISKRIRHLVATKNTILFFAITTIISGIIAILLVPNEVMIMKEREIWEIAFVSFVSIVFIASFCCVAIHNTIDNYKYIIEKQKDIDNQYHHNYMD